MCLHRLVPWDRNTIGKTLKPLDSISSATAAAAGAGDRMLVKEAARIKVVLDSASRSYPRYVVLSVFFVDCAWCML